MTVEKGSTQSKWIRENCKQIHVSCRKALKLFGQSGLYLSLRYPKKGNPTQSTQHVNATTSILNRLVHWHQSQVPKGWSASYTFSQCQFCQANSNDKNTVLIIFGSGTAGTSRRARPQQQPTICQRSALQRVASASLLGVTLPRIDWMVLMDKGPSIFANFGGSESAQGKADGKRFASGSLKMNLSSRPSNVKVSLLVLKAMEVYTTNSKIILCLPYSILYSVLCIPFIFYSPFYILHATFYIQYSTFYVLCRP